MELSAVTQYAESTDARMSNLQHEAVESAKAAAAAANGKSPPPALTEMKQCLQIERAAREKDTAKIMERIDSIVAGKEPQIMTAFERLSAEIRASCMIAVRE